MLRRRVVSILFGAAARVHASTSLDRFLDPQGGAAVLLDVRTGRQIGIAGREIAEKRLAPPGSTLKPFVLAALLKRGRLRASESFLCPGKLRIGGHQLDCSHPSIVTPMQVDTALAYSCNCFVAWAAARFSSAELAAELRGAGFGSSGRVAPAAPALQALGEAGVLVTAMELATAYRSMALNLDRPEMQAIRTGLEGAVEYGTGQHAAQRGVKVAGKTGSVRTNEGDSIAWFAGFLPSRAPEAVIAVMLRGRSGGADAAPVAGRILEAYRAGRL